MRTGADLLATVEAGLRSRAEILTADVRAHGPALANIGGTLIERDEAFAQIADGSGQIVLSSSVIAGSSLLSPAVIRSLNHPEVFDRRIPGIDNVTLVLAVPVEASGVRSTIMVGSSLQDRRDEMLQLAATLAIGEPVALLLISFAGWLLAGAALRPVERMRQQAATISTTDLDRRLSTPDADDELARLGVTLNDMLDRIHESVENERRFLDNASHELRTPLGILKAELDLALSRARGTDELLAALRSASEETDHLARLAEDLLVLSRAHGGRLTVHPVDTPLSELIESVCKRCGPRAASARVRIEAQAPEATVRVDPVRIRQALDNLLDNALRHAHSGGLIRVSGEQNDGLLRLAVEDTGSGFPPAFLERAFQPFARGASSKDRGSGAGLGLAIVRSIAEAHGGTAQAENRPGGGARVTLLLPGLRRG